MVYTENYRPEQFEDVEVYFGDKFYPAAKSSVRNFYACQGRTLSCQTETKTSFSVLLSIFLFLLGMEVHFVATKGSFQKKKP